MVLRAATATLYAYQHQITAIVCYFRPGARARSHILNRPNCFVQFTMQVYYTRFDMCQQAELRPTCSAHSPIRPIVH